MLEVDPTQSYGENVQSTKAVVLKILAKESEGQTGSRSLDGDKKYHGIFRVKTF